MVNPLFTGNDIHEIFGGNGKVQIHILVDDTVNLYCDNIFISRVARNSSFKFSVLPGEHIVLAVSTEHPEISVEKKIHCTNPDERMLISDWGFKEFYSKQKKRKNREKFIATLIKCLIIVGGVAAAAFGAAILWQLIRSNRNASLSSSNEVNVAIADDMSDVNIKFQEESGLANGKTVDSLTTEKTYSCTTKANVSNIKMDDYDYIMIGEHNDIKLVGEGLSCNVILKKINQDYQYRCELLLFDKNEQPLPPVNENCIIDGQSGVSCVLSPVKKQRIHLLAPILVFPDFSKGFHTFKYLVRIVAFNSSTKETIFTSRMNRQVFLSNGQNAEIISVRTVSTATGKDDIGRLCSGIRIHISLSAIHLQYVPISIVCWFFDKDMNHLIDTNSLYNDTSGNVCVHTKYQPANDYPEITNVEMFIPYSELHQDVNSKPVIVQVSAHNDLRNKYFEQKSNLYPIN